MRFLLAFLILCFAGVFGNATISVGWATFLMLWKLYDLIDERMPRKRDPENAPADFPAAAGKVRRDVRFKQKGE